MVQKYQSPVRVYKYPFELVMLVSAAAVICIWDYVCVIVPSKLQLLSVRCDRSGLIRTALISIISACAVLRENVISSPCAGRRVAMRN